MKKFICLSLALGWAITAAAAFPGAHRTMPDPPVHVPEACTVSARVYVVTEAGVIGVGFSITAETCSEAYAGIRQAISGFLKSF